MEPLDANKALVRRFYAEIWDAKGYDRIPELLSPDFRFRGSLGVEADGPAGFEAYARGIHAALADYRCHIIDLLAESNRIFARMRFGGIHRGDLLGIPATGRKVQWDGAALVTFEAGKIASLWVLGDTKQLETQLMTS